jgi:predicted nuclease with RNAse H fold
MEKKAIFVVGIDLGGFKRKTTGSCVLEGRGEELAVNRTCSGSQWKVRKSWTVESQQIIPILKPLLPYIKVIAVDGPLTKGAGKGNFRLYEKFLSQKVFRKYRACPLPPALMPQIGQVGTALAEKLKRYGFFLDKNLIEVFPTLIRAVVKRLPEREFVDEHQKAAFVCAFLAFWHLKKQTFWLGYKDGRLFLPEISLWKKVWQKRFLRAWEKRHKLKYRLLRTSAFDI